MNEEKKKEKSWEGKKKFFKDGNPDVFRGFNFWTWKRMTDNEKAAWTEFSEVQKAPIPKEVIEFKEKHRDKTRDLGDEMLREQISDSDQSPDGIDAEKDAIKKQLKELGIKFAYNSKLETLQKKLADATDTE